MTLIYFGFDKKKISILRKSKGMGDGDISGSIKHKITPEEKFSRSGKLTLIRFKFESTAYPEAVAY